MKKGRLMGSDMGRPFGGCCTPASGAEAEACDGSNRVGVVGFPSRCAVAPFSADEV